jgi:threonine/homoserine/homoserine lactone efflux protein
MPDLLHWSAFFSASILLLLIPGPSVMFVVSRGIEYGYRGVVFSSIGLALGDLAQVLGTVMGISALLAASTTAFITVKYAGAVYLIALGFHRLADKRVAFSGQVQASDSPGNKRTRTLVTQAFFAINPKTAVFFLALFPQFVVKNAGPPWLQVLLLGSAFVLLGMATNSMYGFLGGALSEIGKQNPRFLAATQYIGGIVLIGMGIAAALVSAPSRQS